MSIFFYAEGRSIMIPKQVLLKSNYFASLLKNESYTEVKITAPDWMPFRSLETYLTYLKTSKVPALETLSLQKLLWISDYFEDSDLQESLIGSALQQVNRDSALLFLQDATTKISSGKCLPIWKTLQSRCKEIVSQNLRYLFVNFSDLFDKLEPVIAQEIIEDSLGLKYFTGLDHSPMLSRVQRLYGVSGNCELLSKIERKIQDQQLKEVFSWKTKLKNPESEKSESQEFYINNTKWQLSISCHKSLLKISISFKSENSESVLAVYLQVLINDESSERLTPKLLLLPLSVLKSSEIREVLLLSPELKITLNARVEYLYSALIQDITIRPNTLLTEDISFFPFECLEFILGLKQLSVRHEDAVLEIIGKWTDSQQLRPNEKETGDLLKCIRWDFITTKSLISLSSKYPCLKDYQCFKKLFRDQLEAKMSLKENKDKPRVAYKTSQKENFRSQKDCIESLAQVLLEVDFEDPFKKEHPGRTELELTITEQEQEIKQLRSRYSSLMNSQALEPRAEKLDVSGESFHRTARNHSIPKRPSMSPSTTKANKIGFLFNNLLRKLNSKNV